MPTYDVDVLVIGGGSAGITASTMAAALGAKTALVEHSNLGGNSSSDGGSASRAFLKASRVAHTIRTASRFGFVGAEPEFDFKSITESVHDVRQRMYQKADSSLYLQKHNISVLHGTAVFIDANTVQVEGDTSQILTSRYIVICTGSTQAKALIPGLSPQVGLTNETIFNLNELPERLTILGGGSVGIEMAQAFTRFGSQVTVVEAADEILPGDEPESSAVLRRLLEQEGVRFLLGSRAEVSGHDDKGHWVQVGTGERWQSVRCDRLLIATGRQPNVTGLGLDLAGVAYSDDGIHVSNSCQTSTPHIYACGDVTARLRHIQSPENMARTAISRLLLKIPASTEAIAIPRVTCTQPESARLGKTSLELRNDGTRFATIQFPFSDIDRAVVDRVSEGFIMIHHSAYSGKIYGVHIVGEHAGEMINEFAMAMRHNLTLRQVADTAHASATYLLGVKRAADLWRDQHDSPTMFGIVKSLFGYRGKVSDKVG